MFRVLRIVCIVVIAQATTARFAAAQVSVAEAQNFVPGWVPLLGMHAGAPEKLAITVGAARQTQVNVDSWSGYAVLGEVGLSGGRASVATMTFDGAGAVAAQFRGSVLRTWGHPWRVAANQTFAGPEMRLTAMFVTIGGGYYWHVGPAAHDRRFGALTLGIGF